MFTYVFDIVLKHRQIYVQASNHAAKWCKRRARTRSTSAMTTIGNSARSCIRAIHAGGEHRTMSSRVAPWTTMHQFTPNHMLPNNIMARIHSALMAPATSSLCGAFRVTDDDVIEQEGVVARKITNYTSKACRNE